jgi:hypothetical protein
LWAESTIVLASSRLPLWLIPISAITRGLYAGPTLRVPISKNIENNYKNTII